MRDATTVLLLGKETKIDELAEHLAEKIALYKSGHIPVNELTAQISGPNGVKMGTLQDVQNILGKAGILKVQYLPDERKASEAPIF